ncbi:MAG: hypothetical protein KJ880_00370, partial [Candidatus Omnitrophica bacterium]|nr:hypothetical protein [Candidatus Omnitrophota bacterium]
MTKEQFVQRQAQQKADQAKALKYRGGLVNDLTSGLKDLLKDKVAVIDKKGVTRLVPKDHVHDSTWWRFTSLGGYEEVTDAATGKKMKIDTGFISGVNLKKMPQVASSIRADGKKVDVFYDPVSGKAFKLRYELGNEDAQVERGTLVRPGYNSNDSASVIVAATGRTDKDGYEAFAIGDRPGDRFTDISITIPGIYSKQTTGGTLALTSAVREGEIVRAVYDYAHTDTAQLVNLMTSGNMVIPQEINPVVANILVKTIESKDLGGFGPHAKEIIQSGKDFIASPSIDGSKAVMNLAFLSLAADNKKSLDAGIEAMNNDLGVNTSLARWYGRSPGRYIWGTDAAAENIDASITAKASLMQAVKDISSGDQRLANRGYQDIINTGSMANGLLGDVNRNLAWAGLGDETFQFGVVTLATAGIGSAFNAAGVVRATDITGRTFLTTVNALNKAQYLPGFIQTVEYGTYFVNAAKNTALVWGGIKGGSSLLKETIMYNYNTNPNKAFNWFKVISDTVSGAKQGMIFQSAFSGAGLALEGIGSLAKATPAMQAFADVGKFAKEYPRLTSMLKWGTISGVDYTATQYLYANAYGKDYSFRAMAKDFGIGFVPGAILGGVGSKWLNEGRHLTQVGKAFLVGGVSNVISGNAATYANDRTFLTAGQNIFNFSIGGFGGAVFGPMRQAWGSSIAETLQGYGLYPEQFWRGSLHGAKDFAIIMPLWSSLGMPLTYSSRRLILREDADTAWRYAMNRFDPQGLGFKAALAMHALQGAEMGLYFGHFMNVLAVPDTALLGNISIEQMNWLESRIAAFATKHSVRGLGKSLSEPGRQIAAFQDEHIATAITGAARKGSGLFLTAEDRAFAGVVGGQPFFGYRLITPLGTPFSSPGSNTLQRLLGKVINQVDSLCFIVPYLTVNSTAAEAFFTSKTFGLGMKQEKAQAWAQNSGFVSLFLLPKAVSAIRSISPQQYREHIHRNTKEEVRDLEAKQLGDGINNPASNARSNRDIDSVTIERNGSRVNVAELTRVAEKGLYTNPYTGEQLIVAVVEKGFVLLPAQSNAAGKPESPSVIPKELSESTSSSGDHPIAMDQGPSRGILPTSAEIRGRRDVGDGRIVHFVDQSTLNSSGARGAVDMERPENIYLSREATPRTAQHEDIESLGHQQYGSQMTDSTARLIHDMSDGVVRNSDGSVNIELTQDMQSRAKVHEGKYEGWQSKAQASAMAAGDAARVDASAVSTDLRRTPNQPAGTIPIVNERPLGFERLSFAFDNEAGKPEEGNGTSLGKVATERVTMPGAIKVGNSIMQGDVEVARIDGGVLRFTDEGISRGYGLKGQEGIPAKPVVGEVPRSTPFVGREDLRLSSNVGDPAAGVMHRMGIDFAINPEQIDGISRVEQIVSGQIAESGRDIRLVRIAMGSGKDSCQPVLYSELLRAQGETGRLLVTVRSETQAQSTANEIAKYLERVGVRDGVRVVSKDAAEGILSSKDARVVVVPHEDLDYLAGIPKEDGRPLIEALANGRRAWDPEMEGRPGLLMGEQAYKTVGEADRLEAQRSHEQLTRELGSETAVSSQGREILTERMVDGQRVKITHFNPELLERALEGKSIEEHLSTTEGRRKLNALLVNAEVRAEIDGVEYYMDSLSGEAIPLDSQSGIAHRVRPHDPLKAVAYVLVGAKKAAEVGRSLPEPK